MNRKLTVLEASRESGYGFNYLYLLLRTGKLAGEKVNGQWRIDESALRSLPRGTAPNGQLTAQRV